LLSFKGPVPWVASDCPSRARLSTRFQAVHGFGTFQVVHGFGAAFTEAAGLSWLSLTPVSRAQLLELDYVG